MGSADLAQKGCFARRTGKSADLPQKGCFARQTGKRGNSNDVCTVLFGARGVIVVRYCFSNCNTVLFFSGGADVIM